MKNPLYGIRFRSERFFHVLGEGWFFEAREGMFGPYGTRPRAKEALSRLIARFPRKRPEKPRNRAASNQTSGRSVRFA